MNTTLKAMLLAAAGSGLMSGASTPLPPAASAPQANGSAPSMERTGLTPRGFLAQTTPNPKHACKGKNDCKGVGGCNTGDNGCKAKNSCKGKGGCNTM